MNLPALLRENIPHTIPREIISRLQEAVSQDDNGVFVERLESYVASGRPFRAQDLVLVMFEALKRDNDSVVHALLQHGMTIPPHFAVVAATYKARRSFRLFLDHGLDINEPVNNTDPPAFAYGLTDEDFTLWLLDQGADLNRQTLIDYTALSYAVQYSPPAIIATLLERGGDVRKGEVLQYALDRESDVLRAVRQLVERGAPLSKTMYCDHEASMAMSFFMRLGTPLHKAAERGLADVVSYLLGKGADAAIRDAKGWTAAERAVEAGHDEAARILGAGL